MRSKRMNPRSLGTGSSMNLSMSSLNDSDVVNTLNEIPNDMLRNVQFSFPSYVPGKIDSPKADSDGFPIVSQNDYGSLKDLQAECWNKFGRNPQISSHVRDFSGRLAGWGLDFTSAVFEIDSVIEEIMDDPRNDLRIYLPKYVARSEVEGELFLMLTLHLDGFVEVDFIDPSIIGPGGDNNSGILFHPYKTTYPLAYIIDFNVGNYKKKNKTTGVHSGNLSNMYNQVMVPSINLAYFPDLLSVLKGHNDYHSENIKFSIDNRKQFNPLQNFYRYVVCWDRGFLTQRNASHIRTTIEWVNHYEELKKYEIEHKKSSGAYLWTVEVENLKSFRTWLALSEEERKKTGITQPKDAGGTIVLPPGLKMSVLTPELPNISDSDTDIMQMVSSGLNKPQDMMTGDYRSTYASVKASQGPQSDRTYDDLSYFYRFLQTFWRGVFKIRSAVTGFKEHRYIDEVIGYKDKDPIYKRIKRPSYKLVDICLPVSKLEDLESTAKALLGTKHGSVVDTLGIPPSEIAKRMGFSNYDYMRRRSSSELEHYPELISTSDAESVQESKEAEPPKNGNKKSDDKSKENKSNDNNNKKSKRTK